MYGFCPLSSGSSGNSIFLGTKKTRLLFDVGISFKKLREKLAEIDVEIDTIDAVVISHEHADHIKALEMITKKLNIPVLCNSDTAKAICQTQEIRPKFKIFSTGESFHFGEVEIHPFSIQHDTLDPVAFVVNLDDIRIGICTDLGFVTKLVSHHLKDCDYLFLEANHEEEMVHSCARPMVYKQRVLSRQGHLSNRACAELIEQVHNPKLKRVYLAHLSSECNTPEVALRTVGSHLLKVKKEVELKIAFQDQVSEKVLFDEQDSKVSEKEKSSGLN